MHTNCTKTVLIIDDDKAIREYLHFILESEGYSIFEAENGQEGLNILEQQQVTIIITDLIMPEKEGVETIREIIKKYPQSRIIAMSGAFNRENYLMITKALGAHAIIRKPFPKAEVISAVSSVLSDT